MTPSSARAGTWGSFFEATICGLLGVESIPAYLATDAGLEWLTEKRRWEPVEAPASGPARVVSSRKN